MSRKQRQITHSYLPSAGATASSLEYNHQHYHRRVAGLTARNCMTSLQSRSCACESVTHDYVLYLYLCMYTIYGLYTPCVVTGRMTPIRVPVHVHIRRHQHAQINLSSQLWILFLVVLISISPNPCSGGTLANANISNLPDPKPVSSIPWPPHCHLFVQPACNPYTRAPTTTISYQRSCRDPERTLKAPLMCASNYSRKSVALTACTDQWGSGTYQGSRI